MIEKDESEEKIIICTDSKKKEEEEIIQNMIFNNKLAFLLPVRRQYQDGELTYIYDYSGKLSLEEYCEMGEIKVNKALEILHNILKNIKVSEKYFFKKNDFIIRPEYIYLDRKKIGISMCYGVGNSGDFYEEFKSLVEMLLKNLDHKCEASEINCFYEFYDMLADGGVSMEEWEEYLNIYLSGKERDTGRSQKTSKNTDFKDQARTDERQIIYHFVRCYFTKRKKRNNGLIFNFLEKTLFHNDESSISDCGIIEDKFICKKTEIINIGREIKDVNEIQGEKNIVINVSVISKIHAKLSWNEDELLIEDMGSLNGTYLNERRLSPHIKTRCMPGDVISFGNINYEVKLNQ